jgi:hypothetical protein
MRKVVDVKEKVLTTNSGQKFVQQATILMPNGCYRHPVDYYDATTGPVLITSEELERKRIPVYLTLVALMGRVSCLYA